MFPEPTALKTNNDKAKTTVTAKLDCPAVKERKVGNKYGADYLLHIDQKVELCMKDLQPYLQPECNLAYLSRLVDIPIHHLAYYFREERKQPFNDYRNELRVNHAKSLIMAGKAKEMTIEAIGLMSGFTNRTTFFSCFKKIEGSTLGTFADQNTK